MRTTDTTRLLMLAVLLGCPAARVDDDGSDTLLSATDPTTVGTGTDPSTTNTTPPDPDSSSTTSDDDSGSSSGEPADPCGTGRACLHPPPLGWIGPVSIAKGDSPESLPSCVDPYPGNEIARYEGFVDPGPAECECSCGLEAAACQMYAYTGAGTNCFTNINYGTEGCYALPTPVSAGGLYVASYPNGAAACNQEASENIPPIPWDAIVKGCTGGYSDESCDTTDRICYNAPAEGFEQQICYIAQGDLPCPPDTDYVEKTVRFSSFDDTRGCTNCQCGQLSYCLEEYDYYTTADCSGSPAGTVSNAVCQTGVTAAAVEFDFTGASCPVLSMSEPEGTAEALDPWTYCCATL